MTPPSGPESKLAEAVEQALANAGVEYQRESKLPKGRVDLRVGTTAIELKVQGTPSAVAKQLGRYLDDPTVTDVVLVTTSAKHRVLIPDLRTGKRLYVVYLPRM